MKENMILMVSNWPYSENDFVGVFENSLVRFMYKNTWLSIGKDHTLG